MFLTLFLITFGMAPSLIPAWPIGGFGDTALGYDMTGDYFDGYNAPWSPDYLRGSRWMTPPFPRGPFDRYGYGTPGDFGYPFGMGPDSFSPRTADVSKEKYVRDYPYGETEVGVRDSMTVSSGRPPLPRMYPPYMPPYNPRSYGFRPYYNDYDAPYYRRGFGLGYPRTSSLRSGGDFMYLRR